MKRQNFATALWALSFIAGAGLGGQQTTAQENHHKAQESSLHQRAIRAGGNLHEAQEVAASKLYPDLASLAKASDGIFLVHIIRNSCTGSPSGNDVITLYKALVLQDWKGGNLGQGIPHSGGTTLDFSVPGGVIGFDDHTRASVSTHGFRPLQDGGRYVVFLRFARGDERQQTPALRLTGEGVQGAFALENEKVRPAYGLDALGKRYRGAGARDFIAEVRGILRAAGKGVPLHSMAPPEPMNSLFLSPGHLEALGLHLPSYMPAVRDLIGYQLTSVSAGSSKDRTIEWDSLPGQHGYGEEGLLREEDTNMLPLSPNFTLVEPTQRHYAYGLNGAFVVARTIVIAAATTDGEVRSTIIMGDPRNRGGEGQFMIAPKVTFNVVLPDDPQITKIVFLRPMSADPPLLFRLEQIGKIELKPRSATNVR